eukprot:jgi/Tetstr1/420895/TSEL_011958.t1
MQAACTILQMLHQTQGSVNYVLENVPGARRFPKLRHAMGSPIMSPRISEDARRRYLGAAVDANICTWLVSAISKQPISLRTAHLHPATTSAHLALRTFLGWARAIVKSTVAPRPRGTHPKPAEPFPLVARGLWQNSTKSLQGSTCVRGATDYATSLVAVYFCRSRAAAPARLRALHSMAASLGCAMRAVRLDHDSAFRNTEFIRLSGDLNIARTYSAPYNHFQNGLIERTAYTLYVLA